MKYKAFLSISFLAMAGFASGCATTSAGSIDEARLKRSADFIQNADGSAYSPRSGIYCPATVDGLPLKTAKNYIADGSDLGCDYGGDGRKFSMFLSNIPREKLGDYFGGSVAALKKVFEPKGYKYSEDLSNTCESASIDAEMVLSAVLNRKNNTATISTWPAAVFAKESWMSIIGVDEVAKGEFMKVRYTLPATSKEDADTACTFAYEQLKSFRGKMNEERGIVKSEDDKLIDFLSALGNEDS